MYQVSMEKIEKLSRNPEEWNDNEVPKELYKACYEIPLYNSLSKNPQDQVDQKDVYIKLFEITKGYEENRMKLCTYLQKDIFKHPRVGDKGQTEYATHKCCHFLQSAHAPVLPT